MEPASKVSLEGKVAVVAGASRGCGRGVARALGETGATVYVTGRTLSGRSPADGAPGCVEETAREVTARGGVGIAVQVDHTVEAQVRALFDRVAAEQGRLDVFVSAVWGGNERFLDKEWDRPFWRQRVGAWREHMDAGPHAFWLGAHAAAGMMAGRGPGSGGSGLIVAISEPVLADALEAQQPAMAQTFWRMAHSATNDMVRALAVDGGKAGIAVVGLLPGFMKTERVERHLELLGAEARAQFRYELAETPEYAGRAVAALSADADRNRYNGRLIYVADLADAYGFEDVDGVRVGNFYRVAGLIP